MAVRRKSSSGLRGTVHGIAQLQSFLKKGETPPAFLILGTETYLRERARKALIEFFVPEASREWAVMRFQARDTFADEIVSRAESMPMLTPRQVLIVHDVEAWQKSSAAESGEDEEEASKMSGGESFDNAGMLAKYFSNPAPFTVLIFEAAQLDQRMRLYKVLSDSALVVSAEISEVKDPDDRRARSVEACLALLPDMARELGVSIEPEAAGILAEALNGNLTQMRCELEKLALFAAGRAITAEDVEVLVASARQYSVWQFAGILAQHERARALQFLDRVLDSGEAPPAIVGALAWMYRKLLEAQELTGVHDGWQAARDLNMRPDTATLALRESKRIPKERLQRGLQLLYEADNRLKSGSADDRTILESLVVRLTA